MANVNIDKIKEQLAAELLTESEHISAVTFIGNCIYFNCGAEYTAKLTKTGKVKKNSVRVYS